jgi:hypothetical protein
MNLRATLSLHEVSLGNSHLDLFLEQESHLITLEMETQYLDSFLREEPVPYLQKSPHRKIYLDYEVLIAQDRGNVKILWRGYWTSVWIASSGILKRRKSEVSFISSKI